MAPQYKIYSKVEESLHKKNKTLLQTCGRLLLHQVEQDACRGEKSYIVRHTAHSSFVRGTKSDYEKPDVDSLGNEVKYIGLGGVGGRGLTIPLKMMDQETRGSPSLRWIPGDPTSKVGVRINPNNYTLAD